MFGKKRDIYEFSDSKPSKPSKPTKPKLDNKRESDALPLSDETQYTPPIEQEFKIFKEKKQNKSKKNKEKKPPKQKKPKTPFLKDKKKMGLSLISIYVVMVLFISPTVSVLASAERATVVVALADIPKGTEIQNNMVSLMEVANNATLPVHATDKELVIGQYAKTEIIKDEWISTHKLSAMLPFDDSYLHELPQDKKAMSISVPSLSSSLSSKIMPGDIISIYANLNSKTDKEDVAAKLYDELSYIKVLSVTNQDAFDITSIPKKSEYENPIATTVVLLVDDIQASILAGLEVNASLHIALVYRGDEEIANQYVAIQDEYIKELHEDEKEKETNANEPIESEVSTNVQ